MKVKLLVIVLLIGICSQSMLTQNLLKDWNFETEELTWGDTYHVDTDQPGWFVNFKPDSIKVKNEFGDSVMVEFAGYRGPILRLQEENGNHFIHVDPISIPDKNGFDLMLWQEVFDLTPGAYELRFKVRSSVTSFQSNVIDPAYPGVHVNIKDVTGTFINLTDVVTSFRPSEEWKTHRANFTVRNPAASTRISFWYDRFCRVDLDDVELIYLPDVIPTYKALPTITLQNEGLADFELGNYPSTMGLAPNPGIYITAIPAFPSVAAATAFKPMPVGSDSPFDKDTVFFTPYISQGADPMQGAIAWRCETRSLSLDSANAYRASLSTSLVNAASSNNEAVKLKLRFWAKTEGKDVVIRVDNIAGSGTSLAPRKVQNVLISGTEYKEYIINDTMAAVLPSQNIDGRVLKAPRYRLNFTTPHSTVHLDYMRYETWDGITPGSPDYKLETSLNPVSKNDFIKVLKRGKDLYVLTEEPVSFYIYNLNGQLIKKGDLDHTDTVSMGGVDGLLIIKIIGKGSVYSQKIVL